MHASVYVHKSRIGHFEYFWPLDRSGSALAFYRPKSFLNSMNRLPGSTAERVQL